ncbi:MAG: sensor histidine kinase [Dongiaceae bacterium]
MIGLRSIQGRLIFRLGFLFVVVFVAASLMLFLRYQRGETDIPDDVLDKQIALVANALRRDDDGAWRIEMPSRLASALEFVVRDATGNVIAASSEAAVAKIGPVDPRWSAGSFQRIDRSDDSRIFGRFARFAMVDGIMTIQVAVTQSAADARTRSLAQALYEDLLPIMLPFLIATLIIGVLTIRDSLAPLREVARQAAAIGPSTTDLRLPVTGLPAELKPLVTAINSAFARLDDGFRQQREFTADAAHELRTPLAILAARLDNMADRAAAGDLREDVERMSRLVGQLLAVAQLEALSTSPDESADLRALVADVASSLAPLAIKRERSIAVTGDERPVQVHGNGDALRQAVRNLAENALQHAPAGSTVELEVTGEPAVHVIDRGPGVPSDLRDHVTKRFWRGDRRKGDGAGLGLAIVARIARAYGGNLTVDDAPGGGARFSLHLSAAAALSA